MGKLYFNGYLFQTDKTEEAQNIDIKEYITGEPETTYYEVFPDANIALLSIRFREKGIKVLHKQLRAKLNARMHTVRSTFTNKNEYVKKGLLYSEKLEDNHTPEADPVQQTKEEKPEAKKEEDVPKETEEQPNHVPKKAKSVDVPKSKPKKKEGKPCVARTAGPASQVPLLEQIGDIKKMHEAIHALRKKMPNEAILDDIYGQIREKDEKIRGKLSTSEKTRESKALLRLKCRFIALATNEMEEVDINKYVSQFKAMHLDYY